MKKYILLPVLILLFAQVFSQKANDKKFRFGLKFAPAIGWMKPDNKLYASNSIKFNYAYGLITDFNFTSNYGFSTGLEVNYNGGILNYQPKSAFYVNSNDTFFVTSRNYRLRYINIPLTLKFKTNEIGTITYFGQFGMDAALKIKGLSDDQVSNNNNVTTNTDVDISNDINFIRLALNIGLGLELNLVGTTSMVIGVNYNNGFTNVLKKESKTLIDYNTKNPLAQKAITNYVSLTFGILF